jgi:hypothetical protein
MKFLSVLSLMAIVFAFDGKVCEGFQSKYTGNYLSAWNDNSVSQMPHILGWEQFKEEFIENENNSFSARCLKTFHGSYLSANEDGTMTQVPWCKEWEKFRFGFESSTGKIWMKTYHNTYVSFQYWEITHVPEFGDYEEIQFVGCEPEKE